MLSKRFRTVAISALPLLLTGAIVAAPREASAQIVFDRTNTSMLTAGSARFVFDTFWDSIIGASSIRLTAANVPGGQGGTTRAILPNMSSPSTGLVDGGTASFTRQWDVEFGYRADRGGGADGLAFFVNSTSTPSGIPAVGSSLGYQGMYCFAIEFDTFDNGGGENGIQAMLSPFGGTAYSVSPNVHPAFSLRGTHRVKITCRFRNNIPYWDNRNRIVSVYMDGSSTPIFTHWMSAEQFRLPNSNQTSFGFSAGTGGLADEHLIFADWRITVY